MTTPRRVVVGVVVLALVAYSVLTWTRLARSDTRAASFAIAAVVLVLLAAGIVAGFVAATRRSRARHRALGGLLPGWVLQEVLADRELAGQVARLGTYLRGLRSGSRLTLAWSTDGVGLWRGAAEKPECVVLLPWHQVAAVRLGEGHAGSSSGPAVVLDAAADARLVVVPCARADGGFAPASAGVVQAIVTGLRSVRDAAPH